MKFLWGISGRTAAWITASAIAVALTLLAPALAAATTGDIIAPQHPPNYTPTDGWQAGTCKQEPPEPGVETCSVATVGQFFETAAAHPNYGFTQFIVKHHPLMAGPVEVPGTEVPEGEVALIRVDLPVGLSVNPSATPQCELTVFEVGGSGCPAGSQVGVSSVTASAPGIGIPIPPAPPATEVPVYNIVPKYGEAARFGLELAGNEVFLEGDVAWAGDYHEGFTIKVPKALPAGIEGLILKNRLVFEGRAGDGTFLTTPSTCLGGHDVTGSTYSTLLRAASYAEVESPGYAFPASAEPFFESPIPPGTSPKSCNTIPYAPAIAVEPGTAETNSPAPASVDVTVPHLKGGEGQDSSVTKTGTVTLPVGMGINPSAVTGLKVCDDAAFPLHSRAPITCPPESKIGTVKVESPPLPEAVNQLEGNVYVGKQLSRDPTSGQEYRIFIDAASPRYNVDLRLVGHVAANPATGQLTTTIGEIPQLPFTRFHLHFERGPLAVLSSPPTCGQNRTTTSFVSWSGNPPAAPAAEFPPNATPGGLKTAPGGGPCPATPAARPFAPSFNVGPAAATAGAYSPVSLHLARTDGQQELKAVNVKLAPGEIGKLAGIPYCPEPAIAAAAGRSGAEEAASSSCPAKSAVGIASILAGTGPNPYAVSGKVFLAGPYKGAPLSLAVITPAVAGPFDLGTVVVRVALFVDPVTAQVDAVSDPIPDVFGGAQLSIREVNVALNRPEFTLNPTSCEPLASTATLNGGGADPTQPASWSAVAASVPFRTTNCGALKFRPKLFTKLFGKKKTARRNGHPKLRAILVARGGDANIARAALTLPHSQFLDQSHIRTICTRVQLAANDCPAGAIYGYARAQTPLLDKELAGPLYLVSSNHVLPDLVADLRGQVNVQLHGVITSKKARIKTVFAPIPDVPVSKFTLIMKGGKHGLLVNSRNLCGHKNFSFLNFKAQNGKKLTKKRLPLRVPACHAKRSGKHHKKG
jgi:hypothetical protein